MQIAIISSTKDVASLTIRKELMKLGFKYSQDKFEDTFIAILDTPFNQLRLYTSKEDSILNEEIDKKIEADIIVFATRHRSESGIPSLTVHSPGNLSEAKFGGKENELCVSAEPFIKKCLALLEKNKPEGFEAIQEATHHGPLIEKPCFFIELGSNETGWKDQKGGEAVAKTIVECFSIEIPEWKTAIALGGPHHGPAFRKIMIESEYAISHLAPKYALEKLDEEMILKMINRSMKKADKIILDWKGLGQHKERIVSMAEKTGLEIEKIK